MGDGGCWEETVVVVCWMDKVAIFLNISGHMLHNIWYNATIAKS